MEEKKIEEYEFEEGGYNAECLICLSRMAFLISSCGVSVNLLYYLMFEYNIKSITAIQICCLIFGCVYMVGIAGTLADYCYFGSYRIITVFSFISLLGTLMLSRLHTPSETPTKYEFGVLFVSVALALLGCVAVTNSCGFMRRDQFDKPQTISWTTSGFCSFLYVSVGYIVTFISFAGENKSWGFVFVSCSLINGVGLFWHFFGKGLYRLRKPGEYFLTTSVDELFSCVKHLIPLFLTDILLHASDIIFNSLITLQALTMNRHIIIDPDLEMPASCFGFFSLPTLFLLLAIIDFFIAPRCKKLRISLGIGLTHVLTILTLVASAMIESRRLHRLKNNPGSTMSALWLIIPEAVLGFKFGFYFRGNCRIYFRKRPEEGITTVAVRTFLLGMGCFVSILIIQSFVHFTHWLPHNINDGRLDYVFWMLAAIGCFNFAFYLIFTNSFEFPTFKYYVVEDDDNDEAAHLQVA